ncbi:hypothetical protein [Pseudomonas sp. NPDC007930]|uniref:hypothetical protein n=1 Tax=Pseudomonas sp. NPDC007930 TaxID=3364417 RepID=UPI0036E6B536
MSWQPTWLMARQPGPKGLGEVHLCATPGPSPHEHALEQVAAAGLAVGLDPFTAISQAYERLGWAGFRGDPLHPVESLTAAERLACAVAAALMGQPRRLRVVGPFGTEAADYLAQVLPALARRVGCEVCWV